MNRIGIDLGGTKIEGVVLSPENEIRLRKRIPTPRLSNNAQNYKSIINAIEDLISQLEQETGNKSCSIGIGTPGTISGHTGLMKNSNTVCMNGRPLRTDIETQLGRQIRMANDANCFALSEARNGAGENYNSVFGIIMGTGVGGGIVIENRIHDGPMGIGGEWGHNPLVTDGLPCYCGRNGCVETLISGPAISLDYQHAGGKPGTDAASIIDLAAQGDVIASTTVDRFIAHFGRAVATVINILDPHAIVLGGGLSNIEILYTRGREAIEPHVFSDRFTTPLLRNRHGDSSGVLGAAYLWDAGPEN
jgi:fructokinase